MMIRVLSALLLAGLLSFAASSRAFTPESGWWWNPSEPGYGFSIEIQDNFIFMVAFAYNADGKPTWYAAEGLMANSGLFTAPLYHRENGTCVGCPFQAPGPTFATGGNVRVEFTSETTARLTWGNPSRQINVQRHDFFLSRNPSVAPKTELWLGEWQIVLDFSNFGGELADFPFFGEVLVLDVLDTSDPVDDFVDGCRPENSLVGVCDQFALDNHDASVYYWDEDDTNIIIVRDDASNWLIYEVVVGTYQFDGYAKRCPSNISNIFTQCLDNTARPVIPVRGWRSASRAFVQGNDNAPSAGPGSTVTGKRSSVGAMLARFGIDEETGKLAAAGAELRERSNRAAADAKSARVLERMAQRKRATAR